MVQVSLSNTSIYAIIYAIIFIMFIVAFASQPYLTISSQQMIVNLFYTNQITAIKGELTYTDPLTGLNITESGAYKLMVINNSENDTYVILILSIIIFICFGCSFLTLFLNSKKLNKFFNIIILLAMIIIIITFHVSIYDKNFTSKVSAIILESTGDTNTTIKTTETAGYGLTLTCMILTFITVVSSYFV